MTFHVASIYIYLLVIVQVSIIIRYFTKNFIGLDLTKQVRCIYLLILYNRKD